MASTSIPTDRPLWVIHISLDKTMAERARDEGFICIGWTILGDLTALDTREKMREALCRSWPDKSPASINSQYGQVFRFAHDIQVGDPVVLPISRTRQVAIGKVSGPYRFASAESGFRELDYGHLRDVEWLDVRPREDFSTAALRSFGSFSTVSTSTDHLAEVIQLLDGGPREPVETETPASPVDSIPDTADGESSELHALALEETEDYLLKSWNRTGAHFETVVAAVFRAMGYAAAETQASGDHGIDVIAHPDPLGLERPYIKIQVKSGIQ